MYFLEVPRLTGGNVSDDREICQSPLTGGPALIAVPTFSMAR